MRSPGRGYRDVYRRPQASPDERAAGAHSDAADSPTSGKWSAPQPSFVAQPRLHCRRSTRRECRSSQQFQRRAHLRRAASDPLRTAARPRLVRDSTTGSRRGRGIREGRAGAERSGRPRALGHTPRGVPGARDHPSVVDSPGARYECLSGVPPQERREIARHGRSRLPTAPELRADDRSPEKV